MSNTRHPHPTSPRAPIVPATPPTVTAPPQAPVAWTPPRTAAACDAIVALSFTVAAGTMGYTALMHRVHDRTALAVLLSLLGIAVLCSMVGLTVALVSARRAGMGWRTAWSRLDEAFPISDGLGSLAMLLIA